MSASTTENQIIFTESNLVDNETSTLSDFTVDNASNNGSIIKLDSVLEGLPEQTSYTASELDGYLSTTNDGVNTTITVDSNGTAPGGTTHDIVLENVVTDMETLLANNQIEIIK